MDYEKEIMEIVAGCLEIPVEQLAKDTDMADIPEWDSMRNVMILSQLEDHFDVMIPEEDIFDLVSVNAIIEEINKIKSEG